MTSPRSSRPRTSRPWWAAAGLAGLLLGQPVGAQSRDDVLLAPTPLILKDGRIAHVSVHVVPFASGATEVAADAARALAVLTRDAATDCFLTAQVIGHVGASEIGSNETLSAHRLARSRADAVQASLIGGGLPAKAIASVWDWQFMVQEARATLWVFSLTVGEDCEGEPLVPGAAAVVAQSELAAPQSATAAPAPLEPEPAGPPTHVARAAPDPAPASRPAPSPQAATVAPPPVQQTAPIAPRPPAQAAPVTAVPAGPAPAEPATARTAAPVPAISPRAPAVAGSEPAPGRPEPAPSRTEPPPGRSEPVIAALPEQTGSTTALARSASSPENEAGGVSDAGDGAVAIVFATNSSYFPPGTSQRLRALIAELAAGQRYRVRLQAAVSGSDSVVGASSIAEAARYNKWLAERRLERVTSWLQESVKDRELIIEPQFLAGDSSRRVIVEISPAG